MTKPDYFEKMMKLHMTTKNLNTEYFILDCFKLEENQEIAANNFHHLCFTIRNFFYEGEIISIFHENWNTNS